MGHCAEFVAYRTLRLYTACSISGNAKGDWLTSCLIAFMHCCDPSEYPSRMTGWSASLHCPCMRAPEQPRATSNQKLKPLDRGHFTGSSVWQSQPIQILCRICTSLARGPRVQFVSSHATGAWALWSDLMSPLPLIQARLLRAQRLAAAQMLMARTSLKK